jgi:hypothetical protein
MWPTHPAARWIKGHARSIMPRYHCTVLAALLVLAPVRATTMPAGAVLDFDVISARQAVSQFEELARRAEERGTLPRIADPVAGPALRAIWNPGLVASGRSFTRSHGVALAGLCQAGGLTVFRYVTFRANGFEDPAVAGNFMMFQTEIAEGMDFTLRCSAAMLEVASNVLRDTSPERLTEAMKADVDRVRQGVVQNVTGAFRLVREGYLRAAAVKRLGLALRESIGRLSGSLQPDDRRNLAVEARSLLANADPSVRADLEAFAKAMDPG